MVPQFSGWSRFFSCMLCFAIVLVAFHTEVSAQDCRGSGPVRKVIGAAVGVTVGVAETGVDTVRAWNCKVRKGVRNTVNRVRSWGSSGSSYGCTGSTTSYGCTGSLVAPTVTIGESVLEAPAPVVVPAAPPALNCPNGQCPQPARLKIRTRIRSVGFIEAPQSLMECPDCEQAQQGESSQAEASQVMAYKFVCREVLKFRREPRLRECDCSGLKRVSVLIGGC